MPPPRNGPSRTLAGTSPTTRSLVAFLAVFFVSTSAAPTSASTSTSTAATPTVTLPSQILQIVPACATDCLATFVQDNYQGFKQGATSCSGDTPSFACLCEHTGADGFTIGEAAISCLVLGARSGACTSSGRFADAFDAVKRAAYVMCPSAAASGGSSFTAAEQTHRTLVATAVVGSEFAVNNNAQTTTTTTLTTANTGSKTSTNHGFSTITTGTRTSASRSSSSSSSSTPTSNAQTLTISASSLPTTLITAPPPSTSPSSSSPTASATSSSTTTTSGSTAGNDSTPPSPPSPLSTAQIIGISVGSAAALVIAVCVYFALRAFRRRRDRESELFGDTGAFPGAGGQGGGQGKTKSPKMDTAGFTRLPELNFNTVSSTASAGRSGGGSEMQISAPMHLQQPLRYQSQPSMVVSPWQENSPQMARNPYAQQASNAMPPTIRPVNNISPPASTATRQDAAYDQPVPARVLTAKTLPSRPSPTYSQQAEPPQPSQEPPSQTYSQSYSRPSQSSQSSQPSQSYSRPQYQPYVQPQNNYSRPALPADWRPRPPQQPQPQPQPQPQSQRQRPLPPLQPPYPASLQTMVEEDEEEDNYNDNDGRLQSKFPLPPLPQQPPSQARVFGPPVPNRDSVVTEFAEDGEDEYSLRTSGRVSGRGSRGSRNIGVRRGSESEGQQQQQYRQTQYSAINGNPYDFEPPYMSPSLVPKPLAAQRLGDDRAAALRLGLAGANRPPPRQNWQRMNSVIL